jgi:two-component system OmpR family sensor kinase
MLDSLRSRLLVWYSAIVAAVLACSLAAVCYVAWRSRVDAVDAALGVRVATLTASLRAVGGGAFDLELPPVQTASPDQPGLYHAVWTATGRLIDQSDPERPVPRPLGAGAVVRAGNRELTRVTADGALVLAGRPLDDVRADVWSLAMTIAALIGVALSLSLAGGWWLVTRTLAPVDRISRTARRMVDGDLSARIPVAGVETEFGQLARTLNEAFDQLHAALGRQQRFTADASHELRTPLTTLSTELQWARARPRDASEYRESVDVSLRAVERMQSVVQRLLALAREEAQATTDRYVPVALDQVVTRVVQDLAPIARGRNIIITATTEAVTVTGDKDRLAEAVTNIVANAVQYNIDGGRVTVALTREAGGASIVVTDTGPGIPAADLPHVFEAFYRADPSRVRDPGGAGLGLAVARAIVRGLGGDVVCRSTEGDGTTMTLRFPVAGSR